MTDARVVVGLSIGANVGDSTAAVERAIAGVAELPRTRLLRRSGLYRTEPWGPIRQDWFVNAAALYETALAPLDLLAACQAIERAIGRAPTAPKGPRIIDIDIVFYGDLAMETSTLTLPHPHYRERRFVLEPLLEMAPDLEIAGASVAETLATLADDRLRVERLP